MDKTVEHTHPAPFVISDDDLLEHVQTQHQLPPDQPWLLNEANREHLLILHGRAHHHDPISFEDMSLPPWEQHP